jgi:hypothetical protein
MKIILSLPRTLTSLFVIAMEHLPFDLGSFVPWRVEGPYKKAAISAIAGRSLTVTHHALPWKPFGAGLTDDDRRRLRRTREHVVVSATAPPHRLPGNVQAARAVARALARACEGVLIDPLIGAAVLTCGRCAGEPPDFSLGDDWLGWNVQVHDGAPCPPWDLAGTVGRACPTGTAGTADTTTAGTAGMAVCDCLRVTSRGLRRFALPEITIDGAACAHHLCATNLLRAVAHRLVTDHLAYVTTHPDAAERQIDDFLRLRPSDQPEAGGMPFGVQLTPYDADMGALGRTGGVRRLKVGPAPGTGQVTCLRVGPPPGFTGSLNDWLCATQPAARHATLTSIDGRTPAPARVLAA